MRLDFHHELRMRGLDVCTQCGGELFVAGGEHPDPKMCKPVVCPNCLGSGYVKREKTMVKANVASDKSGDKIYIDSFTRKWVNLDGHKCFVFETIQDVDTTEVTQGNQVWTSNFRLDIMPHDVLVQTIGDSSYGGFMVCEDASDLFDTDLLCELAERQDPAPEDVQTEYDEWAAEEDEPLSESIPVLALAWCAGCGKRLNQGSLECPHCGMMHNGGE